MRKIVLDTETTGLETSQGHRIIEIGCVEVINRRVSGNTYHQYINPQRESDEGALQVHGLHSEFLSDKPLFAAIAEDFLEYIKGAELIIHNAPFDVGFLNYELGLLGDQYPKIGDICSVVDSLSMARHKHPGQSNKLDSLCKRYDIDNSHRTLHGALLDSEILADVYLAMTGGQVKLLLGDNESESGGVPSADSIVRLATDRKPLPVIKASQQELDAHQEFLSLLNP